MDILNQIKNQIIVSVQAMPNEPLYKEECLFALMQSVVNGGAKGLRLAGARDVKNAKKNFDLPIIGLTKPDVIPDNFEEVVYITPSVNDVDSLIEAGADIIAFDGTTRSRPKDNLQKIIKYINDNNKLSMADISTLQEGIAARALGANIISTTLSGYTIESRTESEEPDFVLLKKLVSILDCPVILEGKVWTLEQVDIAFKLGAYSVVIGSANTRPQLIVKRFCNR